MSFWEACIWENGEPAEILIFAAWGGEALCIKEMDHWNMIH